jgi:imidazolonepropionase-like amidohydrolase
LQPALGNFSRVKVSEGARMPLPLPAGEGWGEGESKGEISLSRIQSDAKRRNCASGTHPLRRTNNSARSNAFHFFFVFVLVACCCILEAVGADSILLTGAIVHTVSGETFSPGQVLIKDGKITGVGKTVESSGASVVDLKGQHLYPGLIAASSSLGLVEVNAVRATRDMTEVGEYTPDVQSWVAVNPDSELIPVARANGVAYALPIPTGGIVTGQSGLVALDGWTSEQMAVRYPIALHLFWPDMDLNLVPKEQFRDKSKWKSFEDQAKERTAKVKALDDFFEEARAYAKQRGAADKTGSADDVVPAWEAMLPFVRGDKPVMIHADGSREIKAAVNWAGLHGYKMILAGGKDAWMLADLLALKKIPVIYERIYNQGSDLASTPGRDTAAYDVYFKAPGVLHKAGVKVVFSEGLGGDAAAKVRNLPYSAAQAVAFGLPEEQALKGITLYPAEILGVADQLGSIETGKTATLFAADGNILDIRSNVKRLWIAGKEVSLETRHTRLYQKYQSRPPAK